MKKKKRKKAKEKKKRKKEILSEYREDGPSDAPAPLGGNRRREELERAWEIADFLSESSLRDRLWSAIAARDRRPDERQRSDIRQRQRPASSSSREAISFRMASFFTLN